MRNLLLALLTLAAAAPGAPTAARVAVRGGSGPSAAHQDAPEARRVLRLADGGWVRERTRQVSGSWSAWGAGGWIPVKGEVLWAREESELLGELRVLERSLESRPVGGPAHQEALRWLCRSGLRAEAEEHATRALEARPDDARLLGTLRETELLSPTAPRSVQDQRDLLLAGARGTALERERAASSLALLESREGFSALLASVLASPSARERALGHHLARRLSQAPPWRQVVRASLLDPVEEVRVEASRGLGARAEPRLLGPLLQALDSERSLLRRNAAQALGAFGHPAAVEPLVSALAAASGRAGQRASFSSVTQRAVLFDFDVEVAAGQAIADPSLVPVTEGVVLDVRILSSEEVVVDDGRAIRRALAQLVDGRERSSQAWIGWWREEGSAWRAADHLPPAASPTTPGVSGEMSAVGAGIRRHPGSGDGD
jgi:hypothetical protein